MKFTVFKLKPRSPFHLGEAGIGIERTTTYIHSDTLASAIFNAWIMLYGSLDELNPEDGRNFSFRISSAFPFIDKELLFPKPLFPLLRIEDIPPKEWKKTEFLPKKAFERIINGESLFKKDIQITDPLDGKEKDVRETLKNHIKTGTPPSVAIGPLALSSNIYYRGMVFFSQHSGLYFLAQFDTPKIKQKFINALKFLEDTGIGGKRSTGCGYFILDSIEEIEINAPPSATYYINLSLLFPDKETLQNLSLAFYHLIYRAGWSYSITKRKETRRKSIWMLAEGSIFKNKPAGEILNLAPEDFPHPIYRYGLAFPIPAGGGNDKEKV